MKRILYTAAAAIAGVTISAGAVSAANGISTTGPNSDNRVRVRHTSTQSKNNNNTLGVTRTDSQTARSGSVTTSTNTESTGTSMSGSARNNATTHASVMVTNQGSNDGMNTVNLVDPGVGGTIDHTGPSSTNRIDYEITHTNTQTNNNTISVNTSSTQTAQSGDVEVENNTTAGGAESGDVSNTVESEFQITISN